MQKRCSHCKKVKTILHYTKNRTKPDGLQSICKPCRKLLDAQRVADGSNKQRCHGKAARIAATPREKARKHAWRIQHRHLHNLINRRHYEANKMAYLLKAIAYRVRKYSAPGIVTATGIESRFAVYGNRCAYCHREVPLTIDHVKPLIAGGSNWPANIVPACKPCNSGKQHREKFPRFPFHPKLP